MIIRAAEISDTVAAIELLRDAHQAAGFADGSCGIRIPFTAESAERLFIRHLEMMNGCALVLDASGVAKGLLLAIAIEHPFGPVWIAQETMWWIDPEHRGRSAFAMLVAYETWASGMNCRYAGMAGMGDDPVVGRLYLRRGYLRAETHFLKAV